MSEPSKILLELLLNTLHDPESFESHCKKFVEDSHAKFDKDNKTESVDSVDPGATSMLSQSDPSVTTIAAMTEAEAIERLDENHDTLMDTLEPKIRS